MMLHLLFRNSCSCHAANTVVHMNFSSIYLLTDLDITLPSRRKAVKSTKDMELTAAIWESSLCLTVFANFMYVRATVAYQQHGLYEALI